MMNIPAYTKLSAVLGSPFSVVGNPEFQILHDFCFQRIVERGNTVATEKLPDYSRNFTDEQYALGSGEITYEVNRFETVSTDAKLIQIGLLLSKSLFPLRNYLF